MAAAVSLVAAIVAAAPDPPPECSAPEYRRLDFWAGDWDAFEEGDKTGKPNARCRVDVILGGCVLREQYQQDDGLVGQSFTIYDAARRVWHQSWVTNRGLLLTIEGVWLATKGYADTIHHEGLPPLREVLDSLLANGGQVWACSACTKPRGITEEDMIEGAMIISAPDVVAELVGGAPLYTC